MDRELIEPVRRFNRTVTQRVGALSDHYLARARPLGASRVLWEIGPDGADLRSLRARLDLDSGYLSRLLRALEADGLVAVDSSGQDAHSVALSLLHELREDRSTVVNEQPVSVTASIGLRSANAAARSAPASRLIPSIRRSTTGTGRSSRSPARARAISSSC